MSKKNTGTEYELTIRDIYENILKLQGLRNIMVLHDQDIPGKTLFENGEPIQHQIDVYWEFELAGETHCCIIQAKDLGSRVSLGAVLTFKAVRDDMTKSCKAIMVTKIGYQKSALAYAKAHGIEIVLLAQPKEEEIANRIQHIRVDLSIQVPDFSDISIQIDTDWLHSLGIPIPEQLTLFAGPADQMLLSNDAGEQWSFHHQLHRMLPPVSKEFTPELDVRQEFEHPVYVLRNDPLIPRVKLKAVSAKVKMHRETKEIKIDFPISMILRSITGNDRFFVDTLHNVRELPPDLR